MMTNTGLSLSSASKASSRREEQSNCKPEQSRLRRFARSFICAADSSPLTYSMPLSFPKVFATPATVWSNKVDLPIPGSPPKRMEDLFVAPHPRTLSNSGIPVIYLDVSAASTEARETGLIFNCCSEPCPAGVILLRSIMISSRVFHSEHSGQRPNHLG